MLNYRLEIGKFVGLWFFACLFAFGASYSGYSHLTKAISELGAFGAPHAVGWNVFGFGLTGVLIILFGAGLQRLLVDREIDSTGGWAVVALGAFFAATAVPADFELRLKSPWTIAHAIFVLLDPVMFLWAASVWPRALSSLGAARRSRLACVAAGWLMLPAFVSNVFLPQTPGVGQRFCFAALFIWCGVLACVVTQINTTSTSDSSRGWLRLADRPTGVTKSQEASDSC